MPLPKPVIPVLAISRISKSPSIIQILDPSDYSAVDLEMKDEFADYNIGDEIKLIKINDYIYLLN